MKRSWFVRGMALTLGGLFLTGCPKADRSEPPVTTTKPAESAMRQPPPGASKPPPQATNQPPATPTPPTAQRAVPPDHCVEVRVISLTDPQTGWLRIESIRDGARGAWASGSLPSPNKIVIDTEDVQQFAIDLTRLPINWDRRVILRIDGHSSELTRKRRPIIHLTRSPAGSWEVVKR